MDRKHSKSRKNIEIVDYPALESSEVLNLNGIYHNLHKLQIQFDQKLNKRVVLGKKPSVSVPIRFLSQVSSNRDLGKKKEELTKQIARKKELKSSKSIEEVEKSERQSETVQGDNDHMSSSLEADNSKLVYDINKSIENTKYGKFEGPTEKEMEDLSPEDPHRSKQPNLMDYADVGSSPNLQLNSRNFIYVDFKINQTPLQVDRKNQKQINIKNILKELPEKNLSQKAADETPTVTNNSVKFPLLPRFKIKQRILNQPEPAMINFNNSTFNFERNSGIVGAQVP